MTTIAWDARYRTGIASIDRQHQGLFKVLAQLNVVSRGDVDVDVVLNILLEYAQTHFTDEEAYMEKIHFPGLPAHRTEHRTFSSRALGLYELHAAGEDSVLMEASALLLEWLRDHILVQDMAYIAHAQATGQLCEV